MKWSEGDLNYWIVMSVISAFKGGGFSYNIAIMNMKYSIPTHHYTSLSYRKTAFTKPYWYIQAVSIGFNCFCASNLQTANILFGSRFWNVPRMSAISLNPLLYIRPFHYRKTRKKGDSFDAQNHFHNLHNEELLSNVCSTKEATAKVISEGCSHGQGKHFRQRRRRQELRWRWRHHR